MTTTPRLWNSLTQVNTTDDGRTQFQGEITARQDGGYIVVWTDTSKTFNSLGEAIVGQRYDAAGNKVGGDPAHGGEVNLSLFTTGDQSDPAVTTLANGNIAVAFVDQFNGNDDIYVRVFDPSLHLIRTDNIEVSSMVHGFDPSLTALADGSYAVAYTVGSGNDIFGPGTDDHVVGRFVSASGSVGGQFNISISIANIFAESSHLATLSDGNVVAVTEEKSFTNGLVTDSDIAFNFFNAARTPAPSPSLFFFPGGADGGLETQPDVVALPNGGFVVVWTDPDGPAATDIRAAVLSNGGAPVASNILVNTTTAGQQDHASVVALADGGFLVSWRSGNTLVEAQRFDALGHKIGVEFTVEGGLPNHPDAALLSDGRIAFAIDDASTGELDVTTSIFSTAAPNDFNANGISDILWQGRNGMPAIWQMDGLNAVSAGAAGSFNPGSSWQVRDGGDFNGDGRSDILWQSNDGTAAIWLMNGSTVLSNGAAGPFNPGPSWQIKASGDFNGDSKSDILWQNDDGTPAIWLMNGTNAVSVGAVGPFNPGPSWQIEGSSDFNGDNRSDILWQNSDGTPAIWLMDGLNFVSGGVAGSFNPGSDWHIIA
jgi:FG-GAP-like repeat